ncbi:uncharacterized protein UBRO_20446 [Ustilago bromivora]|uniref:Uncharacterized protein n=1 Tax=Ustilago bromivora TaxID=307758 RepID=A0A1K0GII4_9BASI|nr:uncharacterized protein UBRO_20446 [Ustilago bromivora]
MIKCFAGPTHLVPLGSPVHVCRSLSLRTVTSLRGCRTCRSSMVSRQIQKLSVGLSSLMRRTPYRPRPGVLLSTEIRRTHGRFMPFLQITTTRLRCGIRVDVADGMLTLFLALSKQVSLSIFVLPSSESGVYAYSIIDDMGENTPDST